MKYLLYCIFSLKNTGRTDTEQSGVGGGQLVVVEQNGLAAVISAILHRQISKNSATVLAYHKVIESFHSQFGVIPLRFGTIVEQEAEVERLLEQHGDHYKTLLRALDGCVEMGVRILVCDANPATEERDTASVLQVSNCAGTGASYLAGRKAHRDAEALANERDRQTIERYRSAFDGLFSNFKAETSRAAVFDASSKSLLLSLYFLVPKHSVEPFRKVCGDLKLHERTKIMCSGPWPPYNFVLPEDYR
jgi:hypothetical protein